MEMCLLTMLIINVLYVAVMHSVLVIVRNFVSDSLSLVVAEEFPRYVGKNAIFSL
jgi:hypothetical protein